MAIMKRLLFILLFLPYLGFSQIKISALTEATTLNASDWFMAVQGGTTKKVAFYRFSYNQDSTALQIRDSLVYYVQKTELSDSLLNYILRTELNDSLANYTSLDSLTYYMKTVDVRSEISDSLASYSFPTYGTAYQVPFMNGTTDFQYSDNFKWNDTILDIRDYQNNIRIGGLGTTNPNYNYNTFLGMNSGNLTVTGKSNVMTGLYTGYSLTSGGSNTVIGNSAGRLTTTGDVNVYIGASSGYANTTGSLNTFIGASSGLNNTTGISNTFIGYEAGRDNIIGDSSVYIGHHAGYYETGSGKLYIENTNSATPLIWGDFANDTVRINGTLEVTGMLDHSASANMPKIYSQATEPDIPNNTTAYWIDTDDSKYYIILDIAGTQKKLELL